MYYFTSLRAKRSGVKPAFAACLSACLSGRQGRQVISIIHKDISLFSVQNILHISQMFKSLMPFLATEDAEGFPQRSTEENSISFLSLRTKRSGVKPAFAGRQVISIIHKDISLFSVQDLLHISQMF